MVGGAEILDPTTARRLSYIRSPLLLVMLSVYTATRIHRPKQHGANT
jgi:hypothetical protein